MLLVCFELYFVNCAVIVVFPAAIVVVVAACAGSNCCCCCCCCCCMHAFTVIVRPQLHYTGLLFISDCLNPIRYENIVSYTAPLRLFLRSVPGIHYILQSSFCQVIASSYMKKEGIRPH